MSDVETKCGLEAGLFLWQGFAYEGPKDYQGFPFAYRRLLSPQSAADVPWGKPAIHSGSVSFHSVTSCLFVCQHRLFSLSYFVKSMGTKLDTHFMTKLYKGLSLEYGQ